MEFDSKAKEWDKDPVKIQRARTFAREMEKHLPAGTKGTALEFGCGTGQVSLSLHKHFEKIYMVDSSAGMVEVLKENIVKADISNMVPVVKDVPEEELGLGSVDVLYTLMTLHHIEDLDRVLHVLSQALVPGGWLFVGDLTKEDGSFHDHATAFTGHHGFHPESLKRKLLQMGFTRVDHYDFFLLEKKTKEGDLKKYPLFFLAAQKEG